MRCIENIYERGWQPHQCPNEAKGGDFCRVHDPTLKRARQLDRDAKRRIQMMAGAREREVRVAGEDLLGLLVRAWDAGEVELPTGSDLLAAMQVYSVLRRGLR